jgi:hypothetical protein
MSGQDLGVCIECKTMTPNTSKAAAYFLKKPLIHVCVECCFKGVSIPLNLGEKVVLAIDYDCNVIGWKKETTKPINLFFRRQTVNSMKQRPDLSSIPVARNHRQHILNCIKHKHPTRNLDNEILCKKCSNDLLIDGVCGTCTRI